MSDESVEGGVKCVLCEHSDGVYPNGICKHVAIPGKLACICSCGFPTPATTAEGAELLNCPFCGSLNLAHASNLYPFYIYCKNCLTRGPYEGSETQGQKWNTRTVNTSQQGTEGNTDLDATIPTATCFQCGWYQSFDESRQEIFCERCGAARTVSASQPGVWDKAIRIALDEQVDAVDTGDENDIAYNNAIAHVVSRFEEAKAASLAQPAGDDQMLEALVSEVEEMQRLNSLTPLALIHECLKDEIADDQRVQELMNRVLPGYENIAPDGSLIEPDYKAASLAGKAEDDQKEES